MNDHREMASREREWRGGKRVLFREIVKRDLIQLKDQSPLYRPKS